MNIRCVTYSDEFSAGHCSYNDIIIGIEHGVVGCGSKVFNASKPGDLVIINGKKDKKRYVVIGILCEKLVSCCDVWAKNGGVYWPYNWTYKPITNLFQYDEATKNRAKQISEIYSLNHKILFNSRFCSKKLKPMVDMLIDLFSNNSENELV
jgi:hypothetical protein